MSDNYKILGQAEVLPGIKTPNFGVEYQDTLVYQVPENKQASISGMTITNYANVEKQYSVAFVNEDDSDKDQFGLKTVPVYGPEESTIGVVNSVYLGSAYTVLTQSIDGVGFEASNLSNPGYSLHLIKYVNNLWFYAAGNNINYSSIDGIYWNRMYVDSPQNYMEIYDVTYALGQYVAVGYTYNNGNSFLTSVDGINWTSLYAGKNYRSLTTDGTTVVAVTNQESLYIAYTTDLINWNEQYLDGYSYSGKIDFIDGYFFYQNPWNAQLWYSSLGTTWGALYCPGNVNNGVIKFNDKIYTIGNTADARSVDIASMSVTYEGTWQNIMNTPFYIYGFSKVSHYNGVSYDLATTSQGWMLFTINNYNINYASDSLLNKYGSQDWFQGVGFGLVTTLSKTTAQVYTSLKKHRAINNKSIFPGETHEIKGGIVLSEGDQVRIYSEDGQIASSLFGVEIDVSNNQQSSHMGGN